MCECVCDRMCARALVHPLCVWERGVGRETQPTSQPDRQNVNRSIGTHLTQCVCVHVLLKTMLLGGSRRFLPCWGKLCLIPAVVLHTPVYSQPQGDSPVFASYLTGRVRVEDVCHCIWILTNGAHQVCLTNVTLRCLPIIHPFIQFKQLSWASNHILYNFSEVHSSMLVYPQI